MKPLHLDPAWLRQKYAVEGLSTYDMAKLVGRDPKCVYTQLRKFGIQTRPRGLNLTGEDNYILQGNLTFLGKKHSAATRAILSKKASRPKPWLRGKRNGMAGRTGASNPNYKGGISPDRQAEYASAEWKRAARAVRRRDRGVCAKCGVKKAGWRAVHLHHLKSWTQYPELRCDAANIVTLCKACHDWVHSLANVSREFLG